MLVAVEVPPRSSPFRLSWPGAGWCSWSRRAGGGGGGGGGPGGEGGIPPPPAPNSLLPWQLCCVCWRGGVDGSQE